MQSVFGNSQQSLPFREKEKEIIPSLDDGASFRIIFQKLEQNIVNLIEGKLKDDHLHIEQNSKNNLNELSLRIQRSIQEVALNFKETADKTNSSNNERQTLLLAKLDSIPSEETYQRLTEKLENSMAQIQSLVVDEESTMQKLTKSLSQLLDENRLYFDNQRKHDNELRLKSAAIKKREDELAIEELRLKRIEEEHSSKVNDFGKKEKESGERLRELQVRLEKESLIIDRQRESALRDIDEARREKEEVNALKQKYETEKIRLNTLRNEIIQLSNIVCERGTRVEEMYRNAENVRSEALEEKDRISLMMSQLETNQKHKIELSNHPKKDAEDDVDYLELVHGSANEYRKCENLSNAQTRNCAKNNNLPIPNQTPSKTFSTDEFIYSIKTMVNKLY